MGKEMTADEPAIVKVQCNTAVEKLFCWDFGSGFAGSLMGHSVCCSMQSLAAQRLELQKADRERQNDKSCLCFMSRADGADTGKIQFESSATLYSLSCIIKVSGGHQPLIVLQVFAANIERPAVVP